jgi:hypothetical protein
MWVRLRAWLAGFAVSEYGVVVVYALGCVCPKGVWFVVEYMV